MTRLVARLLMCVALTVYFGEGLAMSPETLVNRSCVVEIPGDVNASGAVTAADVIYLVNAIFLRGPFPQPCYEAGDINCTGSITSADVILLVNYTFKSGPAPCDICQLPEWQCP